MHHCTRGWEFDQPKIENVKCQGEGVGEGGWWPAGGYSTFDLDW